MHEETGQTKKTKCRAPGRDLAASTDERGVPQALGRCESGRVVYFRIRKKTTREVTTMESTEKKPRGKRGQGCVYRPANSRNWWIKFSMNGRTIQQSADTESRRNALDVLKAEILKHSGGEAPDSRQTTVQAVKDAMMQTWRNLDKNPASVEWAERCWKRLLPYFGKMKANAVSSAALRGYVEYRKGVKAANATINRELSVLSSAFTLAYEETPRRVSQKLSFTRLRSQRDGKGLWNKSSTTPWPRIALSFTCE